MYKKVVILLNLIILEKKYKIRICCWQCNSNW